MELPRFGEKKLVAQDSYFTLGEPLSRNEIFKGAIQISRYLHEIPLPWWWSPAAKWIEIQPFYYMGKSQNGQLVMDCSHEYSNWCSISFHLNFKFSLLNISANLTVQTMLIKHKWKPDLNKCKAIFNLLSLYSLLVLLTYTSDIYWHKGKCLSFVCNQSCLVNSNKSSLLSCRWYILLSMFINIWW